MKTAVTLAGLLAGSILVETSAAHWPAWRGPDGCGVTTETRLPTEWNETKNVRWKVKLPSPGNSTPIVHGDKIFITQPLGKDRTLTCYRRSNGEQLWQRSVPYEDKEDSHRTNPYCSASPVTDGERVIAWFGSAGLVCYDFDGKELWRRDLGKQEHQWGYGTSPVLHGDLCYLNFGPGERAFLIALDKKTGKTVWQNDIPESKPEKRTDGFAGDRNGVVGSWSTPILIRADGREELILSLAEWLKSFDPKTGKELWRCGGLNPLLYTSPVAADGIVVAMGGYHGTSIATKAGGSGDVTKTHRLWQTVRTQNRLSSPVIHKGNVFVINTPGIAECIDLNTGKVIWSERLPGIGPKTEFWSSPVLSADNIYILNQSGDCVIFKASPTFSVVGVNSIGNELTNGSLAVSDGELFIRTHQHLWCINASGSGTAAGN